MSFILDALKKSESDRQRQGGPALFEVKVAAPRAALPFWAIAIAVLVAANLGVVLWLLLRHTGGAAPALAPAVAASAAAATAPTAPAAAAPLTASLPAPAAEAAVLARSDTPAAAPATEEPSAVTGKHLERPGAEDRADAPGIAAAPARNGAGPSLNPDDYAPAAEAAPRTGPAAGATGAAGSVKSGTEAGVPLYQQLAAAPGVQLPQLRLDLHAYAERPADRWVLINMHKVHEGDSLAEGVHVDRITPSGAVLSYRGSQFLLTQ
ncbi:MAG TPA: general secretion pathway protein GspB [Steroidobacteraceae bacterium]|nr:general secretion pathway protein GspB [Steroidobacteraceae bacterium]